MFKSTCTKGIKQSPINIIRSKTKKCNSNCILSFDYKISKCNLINLNTNLIIDYDEGSSVNFNHNIYELYKISFTAPSSHKIDNKNYPLEMHLNHRCNSNGTILIIAVFIEINEDNSVSKDFFDKFKDSIPLKINDQVTKNISNWNIYNAIPENKAFFFYEGSLPRTPCTENITWIIMDKPINCSTLFYKNIKKIINVNARPVQKINNRNIYHNDNDYEKNNNEYINYHNQTKLLKGYSDKVFKNTNEYINYHNQPKLLKEYSDTVIKNTNVNTAKFSLKYIILTIFIIICVCLILFAIWAFENKRIKFSIPSFKNLLIKNKLINN